MLKKLRIKIVATIMAICTAMMVFAFVAIMAVSSSSAQAPLMRELKKAVEWGPNQEITFVIGRHDNGLAPASGEEPDGGSMPVAVVAVVADGTLVAYNDAFLTNMDEDTRSAAVAGALAAADDEGLLSDAGVFFLRELDADGLVLAFVDANAYLATMRSTALGTAAVLLAALLALFALSIFLARVIARPVKRAWDAQAQFVADASHELKTPLTVILANADILLKGDSGALGPEQRKWVTGIGSEAQRMKGLVEEMLFLARNEDAAEHRGGEAPECDLSGLVRQACLTFDAVAFEAQVELDDHIEDKVQVRGDREQLERLVKSLIDNAVKYAGTGGKVTVSLARKKGRAVLKVNNTGDPIAPEDLPHVFDRFWRSDKARSSSTSAGSYGLGLAIAKSIAESQGARIGVNSSQEEGTTFTVSF